MRIHGLRFPPRDVAAAVTAIKSLLANPGFLRETVWSARSASRQGWHYHERVYGVSSLSNGPALAPSVAEPFAGVDLSRASLRVLVTLD